MLGCKPYPCSTRNEYKEAVFAEQVVLKKADTPEGWNHEASDFINRVILLSLLVHLQRSNKQTWLERY